MYYELLWFVAGAFLYKFFSHLMSVGHSILFLKEVQISSLMILSSASEDAAFLHAIKYEAMEHNDCSQEQIKAVRKIDEKAFEAWKEASLLRLRNALPHKLQNKGYIQNWEEASRLLEDTYNKGLNL